MQNWPAAQYVRTAQAFTKSPSHLPLYWPVTEQWLWTTRHGWWTWYEQWKAVVARDEHGSGLDRIGSGLKPILAGSGLDQDWSQFWPDQDWIVLQLTASPWTTEASTRERWQFGATDRKATSSNRVRRVHSTAIRLHCDNIEISELR